MDDAGTEHESGWVLVDGSSGLCGRRGGAAGGGRGGRSRRRGRHPGPRQHASPPLPDAHAGASAGRRPLHVAARALSRLGAARRRGGVRGGADGAGRAGAVRLHDRLRPPLPLSARDERARGGGGAGRARARRAHRRLARVDGSRRVGWRAAAGLGGGGGGCGARGDGGAGRPAARARARARWCRSRLRPARRSRSPSS